MFDNKGALDSILKVSTKPLTMYNVFFITYDHTIRCRNFQKSFAMHATLVSQVLRRSMATVWSGYNLIILINIHNYYINYYKNGLLTNKHIYWIPGYYR